MAKGIVKNIGNNAGNPNPVGITVGSVSGSTSQGSTNPPGQVLTGTMQDTQSGSTLNFSQAFGAELGIVVGSKVEYQTVTIGGQTVVNSMRLAHRGEILTVNATNDGGTLLDKANGQTIPFAQTGANESGLATGVKVNFERIINPNTAQITAVSLQLVSA